MKCSWRSFTGSLAAPVLLALLPLAGVVPPAAAQFAYAPMPLEPVTTRASEAETELEYRIDAARRIYESFPMHVFRGKLPPQMYAIAITETDLDKEGRVLAVRLVREPAAAKEVGPWVLSLIRKIGRFPALPRMKKATYLDIWLVDRSGRFQLDTLTEGQMGIEAPLYPEPLPALAPDRP